MHRQKRGPNGNVASLGGAVRNESEAILEMKSSSNSPPYTIDSEGHRRLTQTPRNGGDQPSSQGHGIQSGSHSTAQSTKAEAIADCLDTDHNNHKGRV